MADDPSVLIDVLGAAEAAIRFRGRMGKKAFLGDEKTQSAVLHQLMVLGEAVKRLSEGFRKSHPAIPWREVAGMRDMLIHGYAEVDVEEVWKTVERDLPRLVAYVKPLVPPRNPGGKR